MRGDLIFPENKYEVLSAHLLARVEESCAILLAGRAEHDGRVRLLVRELHEAPAEAYRIRTRIRAELKPEFIAPLVKRAYRTGSVLIFCHTHPGDDETPRFSPIDDAGEVLLSEYLIHRRVQGPHAVLVLGVKGCRSRLLGTFDELRVIEIGPAVRVTSGQVDKPFNRDVFDRQIRAFGDAGQRTLAAMKVGIVGLGGTGSLVAQQLAYLGIRQFLLIDFDRADPTNLNRLVGASPQQTNELKIDIAAKYILHIRPSSKIESVEGSVLDELTAKRLLECDFVFCCTDNHGSRAVVQQIAYQYYLPCIDMGVVITAENDTVTHIAARVQMMAPGLPCLTCGNLLDADAVRYDLMNPDQRTSDPYFVGHLAAPQPAVISLNGTVASLAVTMFLGAVTDIPAHARFQTYNAITGKVRSAAYTPDPMCVVSSLNGALGKGDDWPLPVRRQPCQRS